MIPGVHFETFNVIRKSKNNGFIKRLFGSRITKGSQENETKEVNIKTYELTSRN